MSDLDLRAQLKEAQQQLNAYQARISHLEALHLHQAPLDDHRQPYSIFDNLLEGCQIVSFDWRYLYVNNTAIRHNQRSKSDLLGYTMMECYPGIEKTDIFATLQRCMQERSPGHIDDQFIYPDGTAGWFSVSVEPVPEGIFILSLDITERKHAEVALKRYAQRMDILHEIDLGIINSTSIQEVVNTALKRTREIIDCQQIGVALFDLTTNELNFFALDLKAPSMLATGNRYPIPPGYLDEFGTNTLRVIDDIQLLPDASPTYKRLIQEGIRSSLRVLLMFQGHPTGVFGLNADTPGFFKAEHQVIATEIANQLAIAVHHIRLNETLARHAIELEQRVVERTIDLIDAKARVETILHNSLDAIVLLGFDFNIQQVNVAFNQLFACEPDEYFNTTLLDLIDPADVDRVLAAIQMGISESQGTHIEAHAHRKHGSVFDIELSISYFRGTKDHGTEGFVCTLRDITQRKEQERQLRYHASLQESVRDAVIATDMEFRIQSWNRAAERIYGWRAEEIIGKGLEEKEILQTQFESDKARQRFRQEFYEQGYWTGEAVQRRKDGTTFPVLLSITVIKDHQGTPFGIISVNHDITERKEQERQLRYHASLQQNVSDAVIVTDMTFHIQSWNRAAERIYGWSIEDVIGQSVAKILQTEFLSAGERERSIQQLHEQGWWQGEVIQHHKDGSIRHILGSVTLVKDDSGVSFGVVSINHDITERKHAEEELWESQERFSLLVNSVRDYAIYLLDLQGNVTSWNQGAQRIKGYTEDEILGQNFERFYLPEAILQGRPQELLNIARHEGHAVDEGWRVRKDGRQFWAEVVITPLHDKENHLVGYAKVTRDLTEHKQAEEVLKAKSEEEHEFQGYLKALHDITIELTQIDVLDTFYKRAVELGLERLGLERLALFLYDAKEKTALGTYGTDPQGNITDERHIRFIPSPTGIMLGAFNRTERFHFEEHVSLYEEMKTVGVGWNVATVLWNGTQSLGWLVADNLLSQTPASKPVMDIIGLYALTLGTLIAQKQIQIALRESEVRYRLLAENITDVITRSNSVGEYIYVSSSSRTVLGYEPEELLGQSRSQYIHPDDMTIITHASTAAESPDFPGIGIVVRFHHKQGHYVWLEVIGRAIHSEETGEIEGFISSARDISKRKQAEEALRQSEERFALIFRLSPVAIGLTIASDGRYLDVNDSLLNLLNYSRDEMIGRTAVDLNVWVSPQEREAAIRSIREDGSVRGMEVGFRKKTGENCTTLTSIVPVILNGLSCLLFIVHDITERQQAEAALRESEERFRQIAENIDQILFIRSGDDQKMLYINPRYESLWGKPRTSLYENPNSYLDSIHPDDLDHTAQEFGSKRYLEDGLADVEYRIMHPDQIIRWVRVRTFPIKDNQGVMVRRAGIIEDITDRKQAEAALRESEEKFRRLMDAAPVAIVISDQSGHITLVNNQAEALFGYHRAELVGQSVDILVPHSSRSRHAGNRASYLAEPRVRQMGVGLELSARRKDGSEFPVEIELSYIKTPTGLLVMSFVMDITERKQVAAELERQRSFLRSVIDVSPNMIFVKDYDSRFVLVNRGLAQLYNATVETLIGRSDADFSSSEQEVTSYLDVDRQVITSGEPVFIEEPFTNFFGETLWFQTTKVPIISADGKSKHVLGVSTDITERKHAEAALRESEAKYRSLVETMRGGLAIFDRDYRITYVNQRFCELLGYTSEEVVGTRPTDFVETSSLPTAELQLERRRLGESSSYEVVTRHKTGRPVHLLMAASPFLGENGIYNGSFVVATDITVQKEAEETLRKALAKEKELGDLKSRFVSMASHEFRTPLATILALNETLSAYRHKLPEDQIAERFEKIKEQVSHLKDIMEDVLLLARMQARRVEFNPVIFDLDNLCRSVLDEFQSQPDITHLIEYTCDKALHRVRLDKKLMRQVLNNLITNAIKYSPLNKTIRVSLSYVSDALVLSISDQGIGIPDADLGHLFEPFHRASNVGTVSGTGLGLVIVKEAVELHGGTIRVESQLDVGTTFTTRIPMSIEVDPNDDKSRSHSSAD